MQPNSVRHFTTLHRHSETLVTLKVSIYAVCNAFECCEIRCLTDLKSLGGKRRWKSVFSPTGSDISTLFTFDLYKTFINEECIAARPRRP